jgi:Protein of unknown function (DUF559)
MTRRKPLPGALHGRAFLVTAAKAEGVSESRLTGPDLHRPFHGVRAPAAAPTTVENLCASYAHLLRPGQFFSGETAAALWRAPVPHVRHPARRIHVTSVAPMRAPEGAGVIGHQLTRTQPTVQIRGLPVADAATTWLQLASALDIAELVAVGDYFILDPRVLEPIDDLPPRPFSTIDELRARLSAFHGRGARNARRAIDLMRPGAESRPESLLRLLLGSAGFPEPEVNASIRDESAIPIGRFDLVYRDVKVAVEYDGQQHRTSSRQYDRDEGRIEAAMHAGWLVVRIRFQSLFDDPGSTIERVAHAFRTQTHRGLLPT